MIVERAVPDNTIRMDSFRVMRRSLFSTASLYLDFSTNYGFAASIPSSASSLLTTTRASTGYADTLSGTYLPFLSDIPRITDKGLLVEEARTNSIRNNSMQGAVAGTPGTLPTNWVNAYGTLSRTVVGTGTQNGVDYIDIRYNGTTSTTFFNILFDAITAQAAVNGQSWAESVFLAIVGGSFTNITDIAVRGSVFGSGSGYLGEAWTPTNFTSLSSSLDATSRKREAGTLAFASAAYINPYLQFRFASGVAIDITLRIGWPQLELGAFATSPIRTTSAAATRAADVITVNNFSSWYSAGNVGSVFFDATLNAYAAASFPGLGFRGSTNIATGFFVNSANDSVASLVRDAAGTTLASGTVAARGTLPNKMALAFQTDDYAWCFNGGSVGTDASGTMPSLTSLRLYALDNAWNGYIRRIAYFPTRLTNAQLQAMTR